MDIATEFSTATTRLVANEAAKVALEALCATIPDQAMVMHSRGRALSTATKLVYTTVLLLGGGSFCRTQI